MVPSAMMPAPGGTAAVHTSSAKKGARPLASRSRGSETLCIFIASSNCIVSYHEKGFRVFVLSSEPYHSLFHAVFHPHFPSIISTISTASPPLPQPPQTLAARSGRSPNFPKSSRLGNTLLARQRDTVAPLRLHTYPVSCAAICNPRSIPERQGPQPKKKGKGHESPPPPLQCRRRSSQRPRRRQPVKHALGGALKAWFSKHLVGLGTGVQTEYGTNGQTIL